MCLGFLGLMLLLLFLVLSPGVFGRLNGLRFGSVLLCRFVVVAVVAGGLVEGLLRLVDGCGEVVLGGRDVVVGWDVNVLGLGLRFGFVRVGNWFAGGFVRVELSGLLLGGRVTVLVLGLLGVVGLLLAGRGILLHIKKKI